MLETHENCERCLRLEADLRVLMDELAQTREQLSVASRQACEASRGHVTQAA